ncbi:glycosyltransferase [Aetokthonos hydrillicola Thurmond2011]|jgi:glycosyltransferase involved in cell wall biosynthesis|uniref:Glycosyltransferase n=1 Tax=Aetokthonos hydrillicola Thurmond2011 TaxID=2712845 RepID=A0AAP5I6Q7_9CYAN|nr:glycosyltransferase family 2 protein [Aetokthonos hydrillicola]MBO3463325.1 glycosyltransferase family 2 protein [Aetokthonos hydrillicola CCALA 1050]MBW4586794.1 glycosyltransferase [Aetokthonos hydrillicola CCALA 1050]MDR9895846.1 glycosyltransferase [Aetokthonos hydrillicola Thurmond2011]
MIEKNQQSQLLEMQKYLANRQSQLLQMQGEIEKDYCHLQPTQANVIHENAQQTSKHNEQCINFEKEPINIKGSDLTVDEKRLLVISRLQASKICEMLGNNPWKLISNSPYDICENPCISIIITLFNYSEYIYECLDSVSKSDIADLPGDIEILVIDDCSTDNSATLVEEYLLESNLPICLIRKLFNTGLADARNLGLKLARSPYVFILDADNWIYPNCLTVLYNSIKSSNYAAVYGEISRFDNETKKEINRISCYEWDVHKLVKQPYIDAMAMFNKDMVLKVGGYSTELIEYGWFGWDDYDLWLKLAQFNYTCKFVQKVLSAYRVHGLSMINTTNKYTVNLTKYFHIKFADLIKKYKSSDMVFGFYESQIYSSTDSQAQQRVNKSELQELHQAYAIITAMQSSKFWQLRNNWFKLKKFLGLAKDVDVKI